MAKTIDDLENLLTGHGYSCKRTFDVIVGTFVKTSTYKNSAGEKALEMLLTIEQRNDCVAIEIPKAFNLKGAQHKEATLACLMAASHRTPLLRTSLDPTDGEIRLRIDCPCGSDGARDEDVLRAVALLPCFADAWYFQIESAMTKGAFDANNVSRLDLTRLTLPPITKATESASAAASTEATEAKPAIVADNRRRAEMLSQKPGAGVNRLKALLAFRHRLDSQNPNDSHPHRPEELN